jgi:murein DD-endopeptidase MepM/ murein hydrolase activator NlpD
MQEIAPAKRKRIIDGRFCILVLQVVTVAVILVAAVGLRLFGGDLYKTLSAAYHEKFDDITTAQEVLNPAENLPPENTEKTETQIPQEFEDDGFTEELEELDGVDGTVTGHILNQSEFKPTVSVSAVSNTFLMPVSGKITSRYGYRNHPITGKYSMHGGIDISADKGTEIKSAYDGKITSTGYSKSYGYYVIISHNKNVETLYAHCSKIVASEGDYIKKGETVALVGSTGKSTGPHLHFEIRIGGKRIDPEWILGDVAEV